MGNINVIWDLEPHTKAKHEILSYYLGAWFPILATRHRRILYVDGFAGPGEYSRREDGSPIIALKVARDHVLKSALQRQGMELVFYFIEKDEARHQNLQHNITKLQVPNNFKIAAVCDTFENAFSNILVEIEEQSKRLAPSFVFIDPFGPTGFPMSLIRRIAQQPRSEVLINFNYLDLNRWFIADPDKHQHVDNLYGSDTWRKCSDIPITSKREECLRKTYQDILENLGWKVRPFRMENKHNQTQYYLFFATSNPLGMLAMKQAMWRAAPIGDFQYSDLSNPHQPLLFDKETCDEEYAQDLANQLHQRCNGKTLSKQAIKINDVAWHPTCIERHLTKALRILEYKSDPPRIINVEAPNRKRRRNSYPEDCTITFST